MEEMKSILKEKFQVNPLMKHEDKEFWTNNEKLIVINSQNGSMISFYKAEDITETVLEKLFS